jgi:hypothetical protein
VVLAVVVLGACVPQPPTLPPSTPSPEPSIVVPAGWVEHELDGSGVFLALPEAWLVLDEAALADPAVQADVEERFEGAEALFSQLAAQGRSARIVLLAIDPRAAGTGAFPPIVSVVAVEPALPPLLLGIGADFATSALENAFSIESDIEQTDMPTPLGDGIRIEFEHRVVTGAAGPGFLVEHDGVLVTTGASSFLISRSVEGDTRFADAPTLETVVDTLRAEP